MNIFKLIYGRLFQKIMYIGAFFINFREPKLIKGHKGINETIALFKEKNIDNILVAIDKTIFDLGLVDEYLNLLKEKNIFIMKIFQFILIH